MNLMQRVHAYHVTLATLTIVAFLTGDFGFVHDVLGYAVAAMIVFRVLWAVFNPRQLGLNRFYPQFEGLRTDNWTRHPGVSQTLILYIAITGSSPAAFPTDRSGGPATPLICPTAVRPTSATT